MLEKLGIWWDYLGAILLAGIGWKWGFI